MQLGRLLDRCQGLEERAAALYAGFAERAKADPPLRTLWQALAAEEREHARSVAAARADLVPEAQVHTDITGWDGALTEVEGRLGAAERLGTTDGLDAQLAAALELELSELEGFRRLLLATSHAEMPEEPQHAHADRLANAATVLSNDARVHLLAAMLAARGVLEPTVSAPGGR